MKLDLRTSKTYPGSGFVFTADLSKHTPVFKTIENIPQSAILNGVATFDSDQGVVLIAESLYGLIYKFSIDTGAYAIVGNDTVLKATPGASIGVNGVKVHRNYVYFTSSTLEKFGRIPLTKDASPAGPVEIIANTGGFLDDFVLARGGVAYLATDPNNTIISITPEGKISTVTGLLTSLEVAGDTSLAWGFEDGERVLYVATNGAQSAPVNGTIFEPGKVVKLVLDE